MKAFVLVSLKECDEKKVVEHLKSLQGVRNAYILFGEWDILAEIDTENQEELGTFIMDNIRSLDCVRLTSSLIVAK
jgi:DNA-binding Lrp family transcriptional regulator